MCTKFHWCLIKNNKVIEVWNFFYKSAFWLVGLDGKIMDLHQQNFSGQYWGVKLTCIPNFSQIGQFLQKLSHFIEFRLVGWLGWLGPSDFKKISRWKVDGHNSRKKTYEVFLSYWEDAIFPHFFLPFWGSWVTFGSESSAIREPARIRTLDCAVNEF